jgi:FdhE protein
LPLIDFSVKDFDFTEPEKYFFKLLKETKNRLPGDVEEIIKKIEGDSFDFREMVMASFAVQEEEAAQEDEEDEDETETDDEKDVLDLVEFFVEESLRPALEIFAEKYSDVIKRSGWSEGYCPVCASEPKIGKVEGEGDEIRRFLFCSQCGFEWEFTPDKCPFCGNEDQRTMESFSVEDDERYYVEVCNECNRYIKTVNIGETKEETNLDVEDIATLHLDMLANEEGYR